MCPRRRAPRTRTETHNDLWRERILDVAEEHFRRIGYQKTSVADIASHLGMSSAYIYRFFPSRAAINTAICGRIIGQTMQSADSIAQMEGPPHEKLVKLFDQLHKERKNTFLHEKSVHDLIVAATAQNWAIIGAHNKHLVAIIETIVNDGIDTGAFRVDAAKAARSLMNALMPFYHPVLIAEGVRDGEDTEEGLRDQIHFILKAIGA
ncbi:transcriptional regulator, TetR family [Rhizobium mongolense subsp. loessense]|uniref:Transcriptional regulator, TetR family n=2 Tax=Rhizobium mongolense TaxID=57676 RepID=A0A1G4R0C1_9HYPH|nr:transcriptional regulator, TetR family [Rhizobium mongolense subsp. loessense]